MRCNAGKCAGVIEDGYCNICGLAEGSAPALEFVPSAPVMPVASAAPAAPAPASGRWGAGSPAGGSGPSAPTESSGPGPGRSNGSGGAGGTGGSNGTNGSNGSGGTGWWPGAAGASRRGLLGAGLVEMPHVAHHDPTEAIMDDPQVPEHKRFCGGCEHPVGRGTPAAPGGDGAPGRPGRTEGFCPRCRTRFAFRPKLGAGELVGGQYEVLGCLAHGGLGWVYLAKDRNVSDRWVVLKGLLDSGDADAMAAAAAEQAFLAEVEHPNIVKIYNFVQHEGDGYIVMEYVGGRSLKEIVLERRESAGESLPLPQVLAYGLEALRALGYLHDQGLLYCDFKPDNAIQTEEQLRLIDLGGVRHAHDLDGAIYGTVGYQAPEIAEVGPSISSDLYTVARTMAVLSFEFTGYTSTYRHSLPDRGRVPLLARFGSYDRLLRRATADEPADRFQTAAEMAEQLTGVLREVLAVQDGRPRPVESARFGPEPRAVRGHSRRPLRPATLIDMLPLPLADGADPAAGYLAGLAGASPAEVAAELGKPRISSVETDLRLVRAHIALGATDRARALLTWIGDDWRTDWFRAHCALAEGELDLAQGHFGLVHGRMPGEAAPKLALGLCAELAGSRTEAERYLEAVWLTDRSYISAAFALARVRIAGGNRGAAVDALLSVPVSSRYHTDAQVASIVATLRTSRPGGARAVDLVECAHRLEALTIAADWRGRLAVLLLEAGLDRVLAQRGKSAPFPDGATLLGIAPTERALRRGLEREYRTLARMAESPSQRVSLTECANAVRPVTFF